MSIGNTTYTETQKQTFLVTPPPSLARKRKSPGDCYLSFIDQLPDGYSGSILVRNSPRSNRDIYFTVRTRTTSVLSYRRNYSHKSVASYRTKMGGATRGNIAFMNCSFLELDGSTDNTIKSKGDVLALAGNNNLLEGLQISVTSPGHYHVIWDYNDPLPWTTKNESYWISVQKRNIELFQKAGFNVDKGASMNPTQNLRNPSQLNAYNYKRRCEVFIHKTYQKTSLRRIYRSLNKTCIANPKRVQASVKFRRFLRANQTFTLTHKELSINLGIALSTAERIVKRAVQNGDLRIVARTGNNKRITRATRYRSGLYLKPQFSEPSLSICKANSLPAEVLLWDFKHVGTSVGRRQKTIFALGLFLKHKLGKEASLGAIRAELGGGARRCHVSVREFEKTLRNVMKSTYGHPLSNAKLREWNLIEGTNFLHFH